MHECSRRHLRQRQQLWHSPEWDAMVSKLILIALNIGAPAISVTAYFKVSPCVLALAILNVSGTRKT